MDNILNSLIEISAETVVADKLVLLNITHNVYA